MAPRRATVLLCLAPLVFASFSLVVRKWSMRHRWPEQTVHYYLDDSVDAETGEIWYRERNEQPASWTYDETPELWGVTIEQAIDDGMAMLMRANPGLRLVEVPKSEARRHRPIVRIRAQRKSVVTGLATANGYDNGRGRSYEILVNKWCHAGIVAHEMLHILGVSHGQTAADRDTYAVVYTGQKYLAGTPDEFTVPDNVGRGRGNFTYLPGRRLLGAYDFESIMHYSDSIMKRDEAVVPKVTIGKRVEPGPLRGPEDARPGAGIHYWEEADGNGRSYDAQRSRLSAIDRWALREMYWHTYEPECGADFNGDGYADLLVGLPGDELVGVVYGDLYDSDSPGLDARNVARAQKRFEGGRAGVEGELRQGDRYGAAVAYGDFNGDYRMDAVVGAPGSGGGDGAVHVIYGARDKGGNDGELGLQVERPGADDLDDHVWSGDGGEALGAVLAAGDFDGDGYSDLAAGAPARTVDGLIESGVVHVWFGAQAGLDRSSHVVLHGRVLEGDLHADAHDRFGAGLTIGDFDADGCSDLVIAVPGADVEGVEDAGSVVIVRGGRDGLARRATCLRQGHGGIPGTPERGDRWGSVLEAGDFDADDVQDLVIASHDDRGGAGSVVVIHGERADGIGARSRNSSFEHPTAGDGFGHAVVGADMNGDGHSDLAVGAPFADRGAGAVWIAYGGPRGLASELTAVWEDDAASAPRPGDHAGFALSHGDFDGNGYVDLVIGMPGADATAGVIVVRYHGSPYDGPGTHVGRAFPHAVRLDRATLGWSAARRTRGRAGVVLP